jgi:type I restriction enzyme S subunit
VLAFHICLPPRVEQGRIVERVEALLGEVRAVRAHLASAPRIGKRFRRSVLAAACSGRLTEDWREGHQNTEAPQTLLARIRSVQPRFAPAATPNEDAEADRAELPQEWMWCRVADVATVCLGGTPSRRESAYWGGTIPWVSSGEVANCRISDTREKISSMGLENSNAKIYPRGTVLIAMIGEGKTRGQSAILDIEACTNQNAAGLVFEIDGVNPEYVWRWALGEYERTRDVGRGGNQPALNGQKVRELVLPLPPPAEQHEIVLRVDALFALADVIEARVAAATARADKLTQSILAKAFRGELVPTEAELARQGSRDYEPASALLERIRAVPPGESGPKRRPRGRARARVAA